MDYGALIASPPFAGGAIGGARRLVGPAGLHALDLRGTLRDSGETLRARYLGTGTNFRFLVDLLFGAFVVENPSRVHAPGALGALLRADDADVLLTDLSPVWTPVHPFIAQIRMPAWVRQEIQLQHAARLLPRAVESEARRHQRRDGLTVDFANSTVQIARFYHEFYRPYVTARFGAQAVVVDEASYLAEAQHKVLARIFAHGEWTAGMLVEQRRQVMRLGWFGARSYPAQRGASEVLDVACIRRAARLGMRQVIMGNSRPSLVDGVLRYKARFGAAIRGTRFPQDRLGISVRRATPALAELLHRQQLIAIRRGQPWLHHVDDAARVSLERMEQP